jgi:hypothetical protein
MVWVEVKLSVLFLRFWAFFSLVFEQQMVEQPQNSFVCLHSSNISEEMGKKVILSKKFV